MMCADEEDVSQSKERSLEEKAFHDVSLEEEATSTPVATTENALAIDVSVAPLRGTDSVGGYSPPLLQVVDDEQVGDEQVACPAIASSPTRVAAAAREEESSIEEGESYRPSSSSSASSSSTMEEPARHQVQLHVYDIGDNEVLQLVNDLGAGAGDFFCIGGVFHAGVEVYAEEWSFGPNSDTSTTLESRTSGISASWPRKHPRHTYRTTVPVGSTDLSKQQVQKLIANMDAEWRGDTYDPVHRNSISFCRTFATALGCGKIPGWVDRAPRAAASLKRGAVCSAEIAHGLAQEVAGQLLKDRDEPEQACRETLKAVHEGVVEAVEAVRVEIAEAVPKIAEAVPSLQAVREEIAEAVPTLQAVREEVSGELFESTLGLRTSVRRWAKEAQADAKSTYKEVQAGAKILTAAAAWAFMEDNGGTKQTSQRSSSTVDRSAAAEGGARTATTAAAKKAAPCTRSSSGSFWLNLGDTIFGFDPDELSSAAPVSQPASTRAAASTTGAARAAPSARSRPVQEALPASVIADAQE